jgi:predicted RNase H-like HicB family nuclease
MRLSVDLDREEDGRWIADVPALSGVMVYGQTREEALAKVAALALRVLAERVEHGDMSLEDVNGVCFIAAA